MRKVTSIYNQSVQTTRDLANGNWLEFLRTAAWNYRYQFSNQVLIYAQRPEATACASLEDWNNKLHRIVKADSAGIALLEDSGESLSLSYIFDVADTYSPSGIPIPLWVMTADKEEDVRIALAEKFLPGSHPYRDDVMDVNATAFYYEIATYICEDLAKESIDELLSCKEQYASLQNLSDGELTFEFQTLLQSSIASIMMYRCGLEPDFDPSIWNTSNRFQDLQTIAILGQTTQSLTRQGLEVARYAVRKWDREHKEEKNHEQQFREQPAAVSASRTISNSGVEHTAPEASEPVREDAQTVPSGAQTEPVHTDDAVRGADGSPSQHRGTDPDAGSPANGSPDRGGSGASEVREQRGVDATHEQASADGRGNGLSGDDLRLTDEERNPLPDAASEGLNVDFLTTDEQEAVINAAVSGLHLTQDEVTFILNQIMERQGMDEKLFSVFLDDPNSNEAFTALREAYEPLNDICTINLTEKSAAVSGKPYGIEISDAGETYIIPWTDFVTHFQREAEKHRFENIQTAASKQPLSSDELQEGQIFSLSGTQYRVTSISAAFIGLQDVNYPIFTNSIPRNTLDILLRNSAPAGRENTEEAKEEVKKPESSGQVSEEPENLAKTIVTVGPFYMYYQEIKEQYPDYHVMVKLNEGYFTFEEDAQNTASAFDLEIAERDILGRRKPVPVCFLSNENFPEISEKLTDMGMGMVLVENDPNNGLKPFVILSTADAQKEKERSHEKGDSEQAEMPSEPIAQPDHVPEPLIDHPELLTRDISRDARIDKVVLTDLLMHYINYRVSYSLHMPELSEHDKEGYLSERLSADEILVSDEKEVNRESIQQVIDFYNRWFVPFGGSVRPEIQEELNQVLTAAEALIESWEDLDFNDGISESAISEGSEQKIVEQVQYTDESFHVGDFYEDAHGRGLITNIFPEAYDGNHKALFSYIDPDAAPGSRDARGYSMSMAAAMERLNKGEATLTPGDLWKAQRNAEPVLEAEKAEKQEPSLFDFTYDEPSEPLKEEEEAPVAVNAVPSAEPSERINYRISPEEVNYGGPKARFRNNLAAIRLLKELESEQRLATPAEQEVLSTYVGWGGLSEAFDENNKQWQEEYKLLKGALTGAEYKSARESTLTAFYTPPAVTEAIYTGLRQLGFTRGNILDPCCGTGHFFGMLPEDMQDSKLYGVELDDISGRISRQLYQNANIVIEGYEKASLPDSMFDVAIGNVPFGKFQLRDRRYDKEHFLIHDYFFAKTLDKVRPGGVIAFVTSKGTMDKENDSIRRYIAQRADLLGAIRLPDNTFKTNAGTEVVSDILFLQKRERPRVEEPDWVGLDREYLGFDPDTGEAKFGPTINAYFAQNPEMVLGDFVEVSGPHGAEVTCRAREGEDLRTELQRAVKTIEGSIGNLSVSMDALDEPSEKKNCIPADPSVRNFSFTVVDGDVYFREDSVMFRCDLNKTAEKRVKGMVKLRNITRDLIQAQLDDATDAHISELQAELNSVYDEFTGKHGIINSNANSRAFSDDSSYYLLCSLEKLDEEGNFIGKADMFYKRTIGQHKAPEHVETAKDALAVSLGELARIDLKFMSQLSDISEEQLVDDLKGLIFPIPGQEGQYQISSMYLSGNVREKLREALEAAQQDPRFKENVAYLEQAIPEPLEASDISVRLGSTWIPPEDYKAFVLELLNLPEYCERYMDVVYEPITGYWSLNGKNIAPYSTMRSSTYGTGRADALDIIERTLNLRDVQIYDTKTGPDGSTQRVLNGEETLAAQEKQQQIKDAFCEWVWKDVGRRERLCKIYNEQFNSVVPPSFSPDLVQFHGLNPMIELAPHQKESVARILYNGNTLLAHTVGAGKTWTMTASAMEGKYLGLCNKSLIVVPNHLIGQWAAAIYEAYPQANVLSSTEKDFEPANRKKFCSRIATGDYDIVVIGHSHFEKIPLSAQRQEAYIEKEMDDIMDSIIQLNESNGERFSIKKLEAAKKSLQTKLDKLHNSKKRDDVITFEELGVDRLYVDESHNYKNLFINTKIHNVAGISQTDSQKASDMFLKSRYIDEITNGMGIIHGTGSPLSNTMAELYTTQRYLQYDLLQKMGLGSFDAWASTFGETVVALELAPEGNGYRPRTRFAKFFNVPELMNLYKQVADIRTKDMLDLPVPAVEYQVEVLKPSEEQKEIVKSFGERAEKIRKGGVNNREDNMLCITNEGRKVALDQRLIEPTLPDNPNSKTAACAKSIFEFYQKGEQDKLTQLVFCDLSTPKKGEFNVYDDLKDKLVKMGVPADEIRFIHEANTVPQKEALFAKVRSGSVRVLMGSTGKMGTGTNVQNRLIAGHDLDAPWRPSDLEQRAGRVIRRGNHNDKVFMRRYVTEGTFDAYMYQLLEIKQRFIDQVFSSKNPARTIDDVDGAALDYAEIKALSSGDERIKEKVTLEMEISKLEVLKNRHTRDKHYMEYKLKNLPVEIKGLQERVSALKEDFHIVSSRPSRTSEGKLIPASVKGFTYEKQGETGRALIEAAKKLPARGEWYTIGSLRGFEIQGMIQDKEDWGNIDIQMAISGKCRYSIDVPDGDSGQGLMTRLNNILDSTIETRLESNRKKLAACETDLAFVKAEVDKPFADEALLQEKKARLAQLDEELNLEAQESQEPQHSSTEVDVEVVKESTAASKRPLSEMIASASQRSASCNPFTPSNEKNLSYSRL